MKTFLSILGLIMMVVAGFSEIGAIIYFITELVSGAGILTALFSAFKLFLAGIVMLVVGWILFFKNAKEL